MSNEDQSEIQKLQLENSRLQLKIRAQEGVYQKLIREKELALQAYEEAETRLRLMKQEFETRERMFLITREENEKEIATLKSIKYNLEARLSAALDSDDGGINALDYEGIKGADNRTVSLDVASSFHSLPRLSATEAVTALSKWEGMGSTVDLLQPLVDLETDLLTWKPGLPLSSNWKHVITLYISAPFDTHKEFDIFQKNFMPHLEDMAYGCGSSINCILMTTPDVRNILTEKQTLSYAVELVDNADIFISFLKDEATELTKMEVETAFLNCPKTRPCLFLFLPSGSCQPAQRNSLRLRERIKKIKFAMVNECKLDIQKGLVWLSTELCNILKQFDVVNLPHHKTQPDVLEIVAYQQDKRREWEQTVIWQSLLHDSPVNLIGLDEVFTELNQYLTVDGSIATLLLCGPVGNGKSTILAKWIELIQNSEENITVFYHFVSGDCFSNSEIAVIYRRLIQKLMRFCNDEGEVPYCPGDLEQELNGLLEKASTLLDGNDDRLLIVIDGADMVTDNNKYMSWIAKPLPNKVRVVLSAREEGYPESWRNLQSPTIPTSTSSDIIDIISSVQDKLAIDNKLNEEEIRMLAVCAPEVPRWCVVAVRNLLRCSYDDSDEMEECIEELDDYNEVSDLMANFLQKLSITHTNLSHIMEQILKLLFCSRNGLLVSEISVILGLSLGLVLSAVQELKARMFVTGNSLISLANEQVQEAVLLQYNVVDYLNEWTVPLIKYYENSSLHIRAVEELPWMMKRAAMIEELSDLVLNVDFLLLICASAQIGDLFSYWSSLSEDTTLLIEQYHRSLLLAEESSNEMISELSSLFRLTGKLLIRLGFYKQAIIPLQHALELSESLVNQTSSSDVAHTLHQLAILHSKASQFDTAEDLYVQAVESLDSCANVDSQLLLTVLGELSSLYRANEKKEKSDDLLTRMVSIKESSLEETSEVLLTRVEKLQEVCLSCDNTASLITSLNQLGVILAVYGDTDSAEEKFLLCLKQFESVSHTDEGIVVVLRNLGRFYSEKKRYDLAIPLMENAYEIISKSSSFKDTDIVSVTESLALLHREQKNLERAESLQRQLLQYKLRLYAEDDLEVAKVLNNLAVLCCLKEDFIQGIPFYDQAIKIYSEKLGPQHPITLAAMNNKQLAENAVV